MATDTLNCVSIIYILSPITECWQHLCVTSEIGDIRNMSATFGDMSVTFATKLIITLSSIVPVCWETLVIRTIDQRPLQGIKEPGSRGQIKFARVGESHPAESLLTWINLKLRDNIPLIWSFVHRRLYGGTWIIEKEILEFERHVFGLWQ